MLNRQDHTYPRGLLAEDHRRVVEDLRGVLELGRDVITTGGDGHIFVAEADNDQAKCHPDRHPLLGLDSNATTSEILWRNANAHLVFETVRQHSEITQKALAIGVLGYVLKLTAGDWLLPATHAALLGVRSVSPLVCCSSN